MPVSKSHAQTVKLLSHARGTREGRTNAPKAGDDAIILAALLAILGSADLSRDRLTRLTGLSEVRVKGSLGRLTDAGVLMSGTERADFRTRAFLDWLGVGSQSVDS